MTMTKYETVAEILKRWQTEDISLQDTATSLMDWMREVEQFGKPHFGETASKLKPFRSLLASHFGHEVQMLNDLADHHDANCPEISAIRRQTERDHQQLLNDLDNFVQRLNQLEPPFDSWQSAMREFDLFFDRLEQHEVQESESIKAMMPAL